MSQRKRLVAVALIVANFGGTTSLHAAQPSKDTCIDDADEGQSLRDNGKLRDARTRFLNCANSACPGAIAKDCVSWLADVESRMPTVVISAVDAAGNDLVDVKVSVDGQLLLDRLSGTQVRIDPGPHRLRCEYTAVPGITPVEENIVVYERQKGRALQLKFVDLDARTSTVLSRPEPQPSSSPADAKKPSPPVAAYVVGGVGILALGSALFFGLRGVADYNDLKDTCGRTRSCAKSDIDAVSTKYTIADVSLVTGIVALGAATILFIVHPKGQSESRAGGPLNHAVLTPIRDGGWFAGYETKF